jgi:hypothetical protein
MIRTIPLATVVFCITLFPHRFDAVAGEADNWQRNHPEWLWCDDFESSDTVLSHRYEDVSTNSLSIVNSESLGGNQTLCQRYATGQVDAGWVCKVNNQGFPDHLFMRWYHKFETGFQGFPPKMARLRHRDRTTWVSTFSVHCWIETDGVVALDVAAPNSSQANSAGWLPIARSVFSFANSRNVGRWICFEMEVKRNTPGGKDGLYRLWADDTLLVERTGVDLCGSTGEKFNEAMLDCYWNGGSPKEQRRFYDNFVISTNRIGMYIKANIRSSPSSAKRTAYKNRSVRGVVSLQGSAPCSFLFSKTRPQGADAIFDLSGKMIMKGGR